MIPSTAAPGSWLMAQYFATGDPGWIVPIQSLERGPPSFNLQAFKRFGVGYPDQELVSAIVGRCVDPKDSARHKEGRKVLFSAAHGSGLDAWRFVTKANDEEKQKQHLFGFPISVSPPVFPAMYSPTGAVFKKNRAGEIDLDVRRPTSHFTIIHFLPRLWPLLLSPLPSICTDSDSGDDKIRDGGCSGRGSGSCRDKWRC